MELKKFIDSHILSNLYPEEKLLLNIGKKQNLPYGVDWNSTEIPAESRYLRKTYDILLKGTLLDNAYFCTTTHHIVWYQNSEDRPNDTWHGVYRGKRYARRWICFVADDVQTKIPLRNLRGVEPTFVIETSWGNYQYFYVFVEPVEDLTLARAFLQQAAALKLTDAGGLAPTKLVRLPTGVNNKEEYIQKNRLWNGDRYWTVKATMVSGRRYDIIELAKAFGMDTHALVTSQQVNEGFAAPNVYSMVPNKLTDAAEQLRAQDRERQQWGTKVLQELQEHDMVKTPVDQIERCKSSADGFINIVCPWEHNHSNPGEDNDGGTQFSPVGFGDPPYTDSNQFVCRHGHCEDKNTQSLKVWALHEGWISDEDLRDKSTKSFDEMLENALNNKIQLTTGNGVNILDLSHPRWKPTNPRSLELEWAPWQKHIDEKKVLSLFNAWKKHPRRKTAAYWEYCPGRNPMIIHDEGFRIVNKWIPTSLRPKPCSARMRQALDDHFECITGGEQEYRLARAWVASCIVHPEIRLLIAWLTICEQEGCGRGTLSDIVRALSGPGNAKNVAAATIQHQDFTGWVLNCTFVHCPEFLVYSSRDKDQRRINDRIKQMVTETQLEINEKYGGTDQQLIRAMLMLASNHRDAMSLSTGDRRFMVTLSDKDPLPSEHYKYLNDVMTENNIELLEEMLGYFHEVDRQDGRWIRSMNKAPLTEGKEALIEATRNEIDDAVAVILKNTEPQPWTSKVLEAAIRKIISRSDGGQEFRSLPMSKLMLFAGKELREHGYRPMGPSHRKKINGQKLTSWHNPKQQDGRLVTGKDMFKKNVDSIGKFWETTESTEFDRIKGIFGNALANELWNPKIRS